ncbi:MAG: acyl-CoA thioesterase II [Sphingomonadales bacterium]|nr:acyl-CoA thioesterase II [Sphingomonadales bacterium]MBD3772865.1 acyl-CoA thioesterase II [Paracoccaceae bacterium]
MANSVSNDHPTPEQLVADLILLLDLIPRGPDRFEGRRKKDGVGRVFGGQVVAQALAAAERTVEEDRVPHSIHAYFLRGGSEDHSICLTADRQFDGRSFSNRRVVASQQGAPILNLAASFQREEAGIHHQAMGMPAVPQPEDLPSEAELRRARWDELNELERFMASRPRPFEMRPASATAFMRNAPSEPVQHVWLRTKAPLPDEPRIHRAVLAYVSDMYLLGTALMPHGLSMLRGEVKMASLDHAIWFHEPFRCDDWLLYSMDSPWSGHSRGFSRGQFFTRDGRLVASTAQEGMIRTVPPKGTD